MLRSHHLCSYPGLNISTSTYNKGTQIHARIISFYGHVVWQSNSDMSTEESVSRASDDSKSEDIIFWCLSKLYQLTIGSCVRSCCRTPFRLCQKFLCCKDILSEDEVEMSDVASDDETTPLCDEDHWKKKRRIEKVDARLKRKLKHRFQDHINKWVQNKHPRFPWKLIVHILLVGLVTAQVNS